MKLKLFIFGAAILLASPAQAKHHHHHRHHHHHVQTATSSGTVIHHPPGCPHTAFCGCGASVEIFGRPIRNLFLAANWFRFPRSAPAPGMAAVRRHHVFVLKYQVGGGVWMVYDANSGHHSTRIHERSLNGYIIVNPRA